MRNNMSGFRAGLMRATSSVAMVSLLAAGLAAPTGAAVVTWNVDADGFWDVGTNWNPGLPGVPDDVVIDVGGPTVRTITYRTNTVTVNSIVSQENFAVTGGFLSVRNGYTNTQETRISGSGVLELRIGGPSFLTTFHQAGGFLAGNGLVTITGAATYGAGNSTQANTGTTLHLGHVTLANNAGLFPEDGRTIEFRGGVTAGTDFRIDLDLLSPTTANLVRNAAGSTFTDNNTGNNAQFSSGFGGGLLDNAGMYRKVGAGTTSINTVTFTNSGTVQVEAGQFRIRGTLTGATGTTLSGGTWVAAGSGQIWFLPETGMSILNTNAAELTLSGAGSQIRSGVSGDFQLEATLTTNAAAGALRILNNRNYTATAGGGAFTNAGLLQLGGGTFTSTSLANSGAIEGFGTVAVAITNTGSTVRAVGGTLATREITGGGDLVIAPGATLDMTAAPVGSTVATLSHSGAGLALGTQNLTIRNDYQNASFGSGEAFDPRANVSGAGLILASSATQELSGSGLSGGATAAPTLDLGNVRIGQTATATVTISNSGTETTLRGAVSAASAPGVTVGDGETFVAGPGGTAAFNVSFEGATAGAFTGQSITVANNFDNVANQTVALSGGVYALANPLLLADLAFGNVQQGTVQTRTISVSNALLDGVPLGFQEGLNASFGSISAGFSGAGAISNLGAGLSDSMTLVVTLDTTTAGARNGTVQLLLASNGAGTSGLELFDLGDVLFDASANIEGSVFRLAEADVQPMVVALGNRRVGDTAPAPVALTITNMAVDDGFSERLDASVGATTGRATGTGSVALLAPEAGSNAISVGIDTSVAGSNGTVEILLASNGEGTSGSGVTPLASQTVTLEGGVYRLAAADVEPADTQIVARVGDTAGTGITIRNTAVNDGYSEGLGVTGLASGDGVTFGSADGLVAAGGMRMVSATVDTSTAGVKTGTLALDFTSDGAGTSGLSAIGIGGASASIEAQIFAAAVADVAPTAIDFGVVRVGDSVAAQHITILNGAAGALTDTLVTDAGGAPAGFSTGSTPGPLAAGDSGTIAVMIDTATAGSFGGDLALGFVSRNPVLSDLALGSVDVALTGTVNNLANPVFTRFGSALAFDDMLGGYILDLGNVVQGGALSLAGFGIGNLVFGPADDLSGLVTDPLGGVFSLGSAFDIGLLSAGQMSDPFTIFLDRTAVGSFMGELRFAGLGTNASDPAGLDATATLFLTARVTAAVPEPASWAMMIIGFGAVGTGLRRRRRQAVAA